MTTHSRNQFIEVGKAGNRISIKCELTAYIGKDPTGLYVSYCPALELCSQGETAEEAKNNIIEATDLFIKACIEDRVLDQVLAECGFGMVTDVTKKVQRMDKTPAMPSGLIPSEEIVFPAEFALARG